MSGRRKGDETEDIIGSQHKAPDLGPLFGEPPKTEARKLGPAGKRASELPPSYDTQIGRHADRSPAWTCSNCGQLNSGWAASCGRCDAPKLADKPARSRCAQCRGGIEGETAVQEVEDYGQRLLLHSSCVKVWAARQEREPRRARMPESAALRGKTAPGSETSEKAARAMDEQVPTLAWLVLQHIISCGAHGSTREECTIALGKRLSSITARINELYLMGHIGSNCAWLCDRKCEHPRQTRTNPETGHENEVLLYETHVLRWREDQTRPPVPLKHRRRAP